MADGTPTSRVGPVEVDDRRAEVRDSRRAALNLMEDALRSRDLADELNRQLLVEVNERARAEALLQRQREALEMVAAGTPLGDILDFIAHIVESGSGQGARAAINLLDRGGLNFGSPIAPSLPAAYHEAMAGMVIDAGTGPCAAALSTGDTVAVTDAARDPRFPSFAELARACGIGAAWAMPIVSSTGEMFGTFAIYYGGSGELSSQDQHLLAILTRTVALAIEHARAAATLRTSEERLQLSQRVARVGTFDWNLETGARVWTPEIERLYGLPAGAIVRRELPWETLIHPDDRPEALRRLNLAQETGEPGEAEWRVTWPDGSEHWMAARFRAFKDRSGKAVRLTGVNVDITERKLAEQTLTETDRRKDEFLAMLGHELRNPLAPILTALELMKLKDPDVFVRERAIIERQVRHVARLVNDMLDIARITRGKISLEPQPMEVSAAIAKAIEIADPLIDQRSHAVHMEVPSSGLLVDADSGRLSQVFANLLTNAARYTDRGGQITIAARREGRDVIVDVTDTGRGLTAEFLPRVFDLFVQGARPSDRSEGGLGLGLALVKNLVRMHGGSVSAHSEGPGQGSRFTVRLPASGSAEAPAVATGPVPFVDRPSVGSPMRILLVDDNADAADILRETLTVIGHEVAVAYDGPQALLALESFAADVAVVDIGLPVMDGYELAQKIRTSAGSHVPRLIAMTGYGQAKDVARSREAGFEEHLVKPVDIDALVTAIGHAERANHSDGPHDHGGR